MDCVELTKTIIKLLVKNEECLSVQEFETDDENLIQIEVMVAEEDLGIVIGRNGKTISSIRNIVQAGSTLNGGKKVKINVDSY